MVKVCAAAPAVAELGDRLLILGTGFRPVPVKLTVCGLPEALSVNISEALRLPATDGVKVTPTVHVPLVLKLAPVQESASVLAKSPGSVPPIATVEMERLLAPVLVTVRVSALLVVLMVCGSKASARGENFTAPEEKLAIRFEALTEPMPVAKSHPVVAAKAG
jgi:hypothetical protein